MHFLKRSLHKSHKRNKSKMCKYKKSPTFQMEASNRTYLKRMYGFFHGKLLQLAQNHYHIWPTEATLKASKLNVK